MSIEMVTKWYARDKNGDWQFNHLEMSWSKDEKPEPKWPLQKRIWPGKIWKKYETLMVNNKVID
jgi:hypothetical protein